MRVRWMLLCAAGSLVAMMMLGVVSASGTPTHKAAVPASWLPAGVTPAGNEWPDTGGDPAGSGYSTLTQINTSNVSNLKVAWQLPSLNVPGGHGSYLPENEPLVLATGQPGVTNLPMSTTMFMATNFGAVALNPTDGTILWEYKGAPSKTVGVGCGDCGVLAPNNQIASLGTHSISYGDGMIFAGQQDGSLVAIDAKTGQAVWSADTNAAGTAAAIGGGFDESNPWSIFEPATTTNKLSQDMVFSAPNGGESPMRGHFDAYNAKTGALVWRQWDTPDPTQLPFILSYGNPAEAAVIGAASWSVPVIDDNLGEIYHGAGNPIPETGRSPGKTLWTDTLFADNLRTGAVRWYYQTVHHDENDYDVSNPPMVIKPMINGKPTTVVLVGGKNGYLYVLNAKNGSTVPNFPIPEVPVPNTNNGQGLVQNSYWPTQPEPAGGAGELTKHCATAADGAAIFPGWPTAPNGTPDIPTCEYAPPTSAAYNVWWGGTINWEREAYNPSTNDLYVCAIYAISGHENASPTSPLQSSLSGSPGPGGQVSALNMSTNKLDWSVVLPPSFTTPGGQSVQNSACYSGAMTTAGGLVFAGISVGAVVSPLTPAVYNAYDAKTGKLLWSWTNNEGGEIRAQGVPYTVNGKEYIALMVNSNYPGNATSATGTTAPTDHLTVFSL